MNKINKAILKAKEVEYLQWNDNYVEMKVFCGSNCVITYEMCPGIDTYFNLELNDFIRDRKSTVAFNDYVIKFDDGCFTHVSPLEFKEYFDNV